MSKKNTEKACPVWRALEMFNGKWTMYVIHQIGLETIRFGELIRKLEGIIEKMFVNELKFLTEKGFVHKKLKIEFDKLLEFVKL